MADKEKLKPLSIHLKKDDPGEENTWDTFWRETMELRQFRPLLPENQRNVVRTHSNFPILQQKWVINGTTKFEWRDVDIVEEKE